MIEDSEPDIYSLQDDVEVLKEQVFYLTELLKFHNLYHVPSKYKKAFPGKFENPFYEVKGIKKNPKFTAGPLKGNGKESFTSILNEAPSTQEMEESKSRMKRYYELSKSGFEKLL